MAVTSIGLTPVLLIGGVLLAGGLLLTGIVPDLAMSGVVMAGPPPMGLSNMDHINQHIIAMLGGAKSLFEFTGDNPRLPMLNFMQDVDDYMAHFKNAGGTGYDKQAAFTKLLDFFSGDGKLTRQELVSLLAVAEYQGKGDGLTVDDAKKAAQLVSDYQNGTGIFANKEAYISVYYAPPDMAGGLFKPGQTGIFFTGDPTKINSTFQMRLVLGGDHPDAEMTPDGFKKLIRGWMQGTYEPRVGTAFLAPASVPASPPPAPAP